MAAGHPGSSPAAWTAVVICLVAFCVGGVGLMLENWVIFWIGMGLILGSVIVGKVMQAMGMGVAHDR